MTFDFIRGATYDLQQSPSGELITLIFVSSRSVIVRRHPGRARANLRARFELAEAANIRSRGPLALITDGSSPRPWLRPR
jgi:hypothetical protein